MKNIYPIMWEYLILSDNFKIYKNDKNASFCFHIIPYARKISDFLVGFFFFFCILS